MLAVADSLKTVPLFSGLSEREMVSHILKDPTAGGYLGNEGGRVVIYRRPPRAW